MMSVCEPEPTPVYAPSLCIYVPDMRWAAGDKSYIDVCAGEPSRNDEVALAIYGGIKQDWMTFSKGLSNAEKWNPDTFVRMSPWGTHPLPTGPQMGKILADEIAKWQSKFDQRGTIIVDGLSTYAVLEALLRMAVQPTRLILGPDSCFDPYDEPTAKGCAAGLLDLSNAAEALRVFHVDADQPNPFAPNKATERLGTAFNRRGCPALAISIRRDGRFPGLNPPYVFGKMMEPYVFEVETIFCSCPPTEKPDPTGMARIVALALN